MDFYLFDTHQSVEVHSHIHAQFEAEKRQRRGMKKSALLMELGIDCLVVWDTELASDAPAVIEKITNFVKGR
jgi:very-short-patch-repair endonuclease